LLEMTEKGCRPEPLFCHPERSEGSPPGGAVPNEGIDASLLLGMREEGMLCTKGEVIPLDKTEILDKAKNYGKIPLDKALRFGIKEK
jgi:hypothetical protein